MVNTSTPALVTGSVLPRQLIRPVVGWQSLDVREFWRYRELFYFLVWRDLKVRYKQTTLGVLWVVLQPLLTATIFTIVFGLFARMPSEGVPYALFVYAGLLPWQLFAFALTESTHSVVLHEKLIKKIYFPRLFLPLTPIVGSIVDFSAAAVVAIGFLVIYRIKPGLELLAIPCLIVAAVCCAFSVSVWLAALNVKYRDVRYAVPFLVQAWFFATPIVYASSLIPNHLRPWWALNPMASLVEGFRWALLGTPPPSMVAIAVSVGVVVVLGLSGLAYFRRVESTLADLV